ncbi:sensor domain-containing diguanylate cyclase [Oceanisphaera pacifica]|uniref:diguanylate cyclase n=1 Tax=Oceanisphaera pacifica TaxID=2818389 RepID=A0ABS3ND30_9GAMM|nr:sensor domain-containing diguanylate cyclase [Oceanisphaera pacifica]MBO1518175.1 GGDEF domain-containing protein [Oceanisphaera pacifica]
MPTPLFAKLRLRGLILILAIASVLMTLGNSFYATYQIQRQLLITNTLEANRVYASKLANITDVFLSTAQSQLAYSASQLSSKIDKPKQLASEINRLYKQSAMFNSVVVIDIHNKILEVAPISLPVKGQVVAHPTISHLDELKKPLITKPFISKADNYLISISHPIFDENKQYQGHISGTIYLEHDNLLNTILGEHYYNDGSYLYVVDGDKTLIYHPDPQRVGEKVFDNPAIDAVVKQHSDAYAIKNSADIDMLAGFAPITRAGWGVVSQRPTKATLTELDDHIWQVFLRSIPLILLILIAIWLSARFISKPLQELANQARVMDNKDSQQKIINIHSWFYEAAQLKRAILKGMGLLHDKISQLHTDSHTDPMTALLNRRGLQQLLEQYESETQTFSVIATDIDFFKHINDNYGHDAGDNVLKELAVLMQNNARQQDAICRTGGEEFILLLPSTSADEAFIIAERLRNQVAQHTMPDDVGVVHISLGVAYWPGSPTSISQTFKRADQALYQAKRQGRNRTIAAEQP